MRVLSVFALLAFLFAVCVPVHAQDSTADDVLFDKVRVKLASDAVVKGGNLTVIVKDGVVTLRGKVEKEKQKVRAEHLARKVSGVKNVVNELKVEAR
jgi:hyperosmotically inducible periplasmic protein